MSKVELNALLNGVSGKIGNAILRRVGNRTLIISAPKARTSEPSAKEQAQRERFKRAAGYAKAKMADATAKAEYQRVASQREMSNVFAVAIRDYMNPPKINATKTDAYTGNINDIITIKATDDFKVASVKVTITLPSGALLENGPATYDANTLEWKYTVTKPNTTLADTKIKVTAERNGENSALLSMLMMIPIAMMMSPSHTRLI